MIHYHGLPITPEVTVLREALREIAWSRPIGRTSKMVEALEKKALAARKGTT